MDVLGVGFIILKIFGVQHCKSSPHSDRPFWKILEFSVCTVEFEISEVSGFAAAVVSSH